jgi:3-oxoacyl-[acyl-carrier protein] reductase
MFGDLAGRIALVTGSGTGLGRSMAVKMAERGALVIINYSRSAAEAEEAADLCRAAGSNAEVIKADVSTAEGCALLAETAGRKGRLDILINNAGITRQARDHGDLNALCKDDFLDVYAVNVAGPYLALQALKPLLLTAHDQCGRPSAVLNISSIGGIIGGGSSIAYLASKGALNSMTLALARALAPQIRVNALCPGFIGTRWFKDSMDEEAFAHQVATVEATTPLAVASGPDDIADSALFLISDASRHVTGELLKVDAGLHLGVSPSKK